MQKYSATVTTTPCNKITKTPFPVLLSRYWSIYKLVLQHVIHIYAKGLALKNTIRVTFRCHKSVVIPNSLLFTALYAQENERMGVSILWQLHFCMITSYSQDIIFCRRTAFQTTFLYSYFLVCMSGSKWQTSFCFSSRTYHYIFPLDETTWFFILSFLALFNIPYTTTIYLIGYVSCCWENSSE